MKGVAEVKRAIAAHFERHRLATVAGIEAPWPNRFALGAPTKAELAAGARELAQAIDELGRWAQREPVTLEHARRRAGGAVHDIPAHVRVESIDDAAAVCGRAAQADLARARARLAALREACDRDGKVESVSARPDSQTLLQALRTTDQWNDVDFDLLTVAVRWFGTHDAAGLTSRQVPLAGFSAKWLDAAGRRVLIEKLVGHELGLVARPHAVQFAYLDPNHLASGGRRFDSLVLGDAACLPYAPECVVIVENKDTYLAFPQVCSGICLFGGGFAGMAAAPEIPWLANVEHVYYWGDIDAEGYEILDGYRQRGISAESLLMDMRTYERFEPFGTDMATGKTALAARVEKPLAHLTDDERAVYRLITSPDCASHRRIEQERVPFSALEAAGLELAWEKDPRRNRNESISQYE